MAWRMKRGIGDDTYENRQPMHAREPLAMVIASEVNKR